MISLLAAFLLAITPEQQAVGLMGRTHLADDEGLLFVYEKPAVYTFWSFGCLIPLDIAFLNDDGTIAEIYCLPCHPEWHKSPYHPIQSYDALQKALSEEPLLKNFPCVSSKGTYRYIFEVPAGWFQRKGLKVGQKIKELNWPMAFS